jgi:hypothetical protein
MMRAVCIENYLLPAFMENGRVQLTTFRSVVVYVTLLTVVKDTPPRQVPELSVPILPEDEEILGEAKTPYSDDI